MAGRWALTALASIGVLLITGILAIAGLSASNWFIRETGLAIIAIPVLLVLAALPGASCAWVGARLREHFVALVAGFAGAVALPLLLPIAQPDNSSAEEWSGVIAMGTGAVYLFGYGLGALLLWASPRLARRPEPL